MVVKCPKCKKLLEVAEIKLGKKEICEHCENIFVVDDTVIYKESQSTETKPEVQLTAINADETTKQPDKKQEKKKTLSIGRILIGVVVVFVAIWVAFWIVNSINRGIKEGGGEGILPPKTYSIVEKSFKLAAGEYWYTSFNSVKGAKLVGSVSVPSYDVNVWLLQGSNNLKAFENGQEFNYLIRGSGEKISNLQINCWLDEGTYYLIVDNKYSVFNPKRPTVNLSLEY